MIDKSVYEVEVLLQMFEIYNGKIYDLLSEAIMTKQDIKTEEGDVYLDGSEAKVASSAEELLMIYSEGIKKRKTSSTSKNDSSSRSHLITQITIKRKLKNKLSQSKISIIDLAGCERWDNSNNQEI